jgi:glutaminyl-peptide cyclotransferase
MKPSSNSEACAPRARKAQRIFGYLIILMLPLGYLACTGKDSKPGSNAGTDATPAVSPVASPATPRLVIDGERAFEHVRKQVEFGPRPAGSAELARTREYIIAELKSYGLNVTVDEWQAMTPIGERKMVNVTAELPGESSDVIMLSSHYDTKFFKEFRFVGANDGGSSTGTLLELARALAGQGKRRFTYWFTFFDGEEAFCENWEDCQNPDGPDNTYGSRRYVQRLQEKKELGRLRAMILLDMIGYKNLTIPRDDMGTTWINDIIWSTAREIGSGAQFIEREDSVEDDHIPFMQAGVECVDIIQLGGYPYWHTAEDTLDKLSPQSLKVVGDAVLASLPRIEQHLLSKPAK